MSKSRCSTSVRHLSGLAKEKNQVICHLQKILAVADIPFNAKNHMHLNARQIFQAILRSHPATAKAIIGEDWKLRDKASMVENLLGTAVCFRYSSILTQYLLHIEFLDDQIFWLAKELKRATLLPEAPPSSRRFFQQVEGGD